MLRPVSIRNQWTLNLTFENQVQTKKDLLCSKNNKEMFLKNILTPFSNSMKDNKTIMNMEKCICNL